MTDFGTVRRWNADKFRDGAGALGGRALNSTQTSTALTEIADLLKKTQSAAVNAVIIRLETAAPKLQQEANSITSIKLAMDGMARGGVVNAQSSLEKLEGDVSAIRGKLSDDGTITLAADATESEKRDADRLRTGDVNFNLTRDRALDRSLSEIISTVAANPIVLEDSSVPPIDTQTPLNIDPDVLQKAVQQIRALIGGRVSEYQDEQTVSRLKAPLAGMDAEAQCGPFHTWLIDQRKARETLLEDLASGLSTAHKLFGGLDTDAGKRSDRLGEQYVPAAPRLKA